MYPNTSGQLPDSVRILLERFRDPTFDFWEAVHNLSTHELITFIAELNRRDRAPTDDSLE